MTSGVRLILLGKQGSGKGTQAVRLADHYGIAHLSTGDLFRAAARAGTPSGLEAIEYMDRGELVPDDIVLKVVREQMRTGGLMDDGFVLDGFPRTLAQAEALEAELAAADRPLDVAIDLEVPTEIVLDRIAGRRVCEDCGTTYHLTMPPKVAGVCDVCGGTVSQRDDDTEAAVMRRLELYHTATMPILDFYRGLGRLVEIDGMGTGEEVFSRVRTAVDARIGG
jgi:adenylate kinase